MTACVFSKTKQKTKQLTIVLICRFNTPETVTEYNASERDTSSWWETKRYELDIYKINVRI